MGTLRDQTADNIRERAARRKQKPVRRPESRSKRLRSLFGIRAEVECPRGLEGRLRLVLHEPTASVHLGPGTASKGEVSSGVSAPSSRVPY